MMTNVSFFVTLKDALDDIFEGFLAYRVWWHYSWLDIKIRYRRSTLGPFWITLNLLIMILTVGTLYSKLFKIDINEFLPYFSAGVTVWNFMSSFIMDSTSTFIAAESLIKQMNAPLSLHLIRTLSRNVIIFMHNLAVVIACSIIFGRFSAKTMIFFPLALLLLSAIFFFLGLIVVVLSTRFRDIPQIIASLLQVMMLFTPIFWMRTIISENMSYVYLFNPCYHFIEILRCPLLGQPINISSLVFALGCLVFLICTGLPFFAFFRKRIPYWL